MLARFEVQHYKSLYDVKVDLEPLTVFIGPNGSGKSNICESLAVLSKLLEISSNKAQKGYLLAIEALNQAIEEVSPNTDPKSKFWHGVTDYFRWCVNSQEFLARVLLTGNFNEDQPELSLILNYSGKEIITNDNLRYLDTPLERVLRRVKVYDFAPTSLSSSSATAVMTRAGNGLAYALVDILHSNRNGFDELEDRFRRLVPNIQRIVLPRQENQTFTLELVDKFSDHHIPSSEISDGTLRILAFLTAIYQDETPSILCFEEIENGVHPWLLHKMMELLKIVSTEGVTGKPVQVIITTHSPVLLNYVEPHQVRAVELDAEGKTQIHALPTETARFQKAMEAYDGALGELWFTGIFGGNPA
jgi:predicted ATPase